jgi:hypothetical protein
VTAFAACLVPKAVQQGAYSFGWRYCLPKLRCFCSACTCLVACLALTTPMHPTCLQYRKLARRCSVLPVGSFPRKAAPAVQEGCYTFVSPEWGFRPLLLMLTVELAKLHMTGCSACIACYGKVVCMTSSLGDKDDLLWLAMVTRLFKCGML